MVAILCPPKTCEWREPGGLGAPEISRVLGGRVSAVLFKKGRRGYLHLGVFLRSDQGDPFAAPVGETNCALCDAVTSLFGCLGGVRALVSDDVSKGVVSVVGVKRGKGAGKVDFPSVEPRVGAEPVQWPRMQLCVCDSLHDLIRENGSSEDMGGRPAHDDLIRAKVVSGGATDPVVKDGFGVGLPD